MTYLVKVASFPLNKPGFISVFSCRNGCVWTLFLADARRTGNFLPVSPAGQGQSSPVELFFGALMEVLNGFERVRNRQFKGWSKELRGLKSGKVFGPRAHLR